VTDLPARQDCPTVPHPKEAQKAERFSGLIRASCDSDVHKKHKEDHKRHKRIDVEARSLVLFVVFFVPFVI